MVIKRRNEKPEQTTFSSFDISEIKKIILIPYHWVINSSMISTDRDLILNSFKFYVPQSNSKPSKPSIEAYSQALS